MARCKPQRPFPGFQRALLQAHLAELLAKLAQRFRIVRPALCRRFEICQGGGIFAQEGVCNRAQVQRIRHLRVAGEGLSRGLHRFLVSARILVQHRAHVPGARIIRSHADQPVNLTGGFRVLAAEHQRKGQIAPEVCLLRGCFHRCGKMGQRHFVLPAFGKGQPGHILQPGVAGLFLCQRPDAFLSRGIVSRGHQFIDLLHDIHGHAV